jgi:hypothetical protein
MKQETHHTILVLPDGETWSTISGCSVLVITDNQFKDLCEDRIDARDLMATQVILLSHLKNLE